MHPFIKYLYYLHDLIIQYKYYSCQQLSDIRQIKDSDLFMKYQTKKICSLISGCLIHTVFGAMYTLGTITPYIASYIKYQGDPDIKVVDISINYPLMMIAETLGIIFSMLKLQFYLSLKKLAILGMVGFWLTIFIASFMKNLFTFSLFYGVFFGFFVGIAYMAPFKNTYAYYPDKKGLCSGVCMMGYGIGAFVYNQIFLHLTNPQNKSPDSDHFFPKDVAQNFPFALRIMVCVYFIIGTTGCLLFFQKKQVDSGPSLIESTKEEEVQKVSDAKLTLDFLRQNKTKRKQFYQLLAITLFSSVYGVFMAYNYKQYGQTITDNDQLITLLGSLGSLSNSLSRIFWNYLSDYLSFRTILTILNVSLLTQCTCLIFVHNQILFFIVVLGTYLSHGAFYGLIPAQTFRVFGEKFGGIIYPFIFLGFTTASMTQFVFHEIVIRKWGNGGFTAAFIGFGILQIFGLVFIRIFNFTAMAFEGVGIDEIQKTYTTERIKQKQ